MKRNKKTVRKSKRSLTHSLLLKKFQAKSPSSRKASWRAGGGLFDLATPSLTKKSRSKRKAQLPQSKAQSSQRSESKKRRASSKSLLPQKSPEVGVGHSLASVSAAPGLSTDDLIRPGVDLSEKIAAFLLDQRSEHTRRAYGKDLKRFVGYLRWRKIERGLERVERSTVIGYKEYLLSEKLEHTTVDRHLATLRSFFSWLVQDGMLPQNPAEGVRFLNPKRISKTRGLSDDQVRRLLSLPDLHTRTGCLHHAVLTLLLYCGLRRSELCSLKLTSLGEERGRPVVRLLGKGNSERIVPLVPAVVESLNRYALINRRPLPFSNARGGAASVAVLPDEPLFRAVKRREGKTQGIAPLDPSTVFYIVTQYARKAGITERISPHSCRATAISHARDRNAPDRAIQEFAGWASPDMITRYDKRKTAIEKSAALLIQYEESPDHPMIKKEKLSGDSNENALPEEVPVSAQDLQLPSRTV